MCSLVYPSFAAVCATDSVKVPLHLDQTLAKPMANQEECLPDAEALPHHGQTHRFTYSCRYCCKSSSITDATGTADAPMAQVG